MSYSKTNWQNLPNTSTPVNATNLNKMETGIADANGAIAVSTYSTSGTYAVGDYVIHNNILYKCKTAIATGEAFNGAKWTQIKIAEEINNTGVSVSLTEPIGNNKNKVWLQHGKLLFDKTKSTHNQYIDDGGNYASSTVSSLSDYIEVVPNKNYIVKGYGTASSTKRVAFFTENKTFIATKTLLNNTDIMFDFTTPSNAQYIRLQYLTTEENNLTISIEDETYVLNNNVYEEFIMPENKVYSTEEARIGRWINGKPLYRRVIQTTTPTVSSNGTSAWQQVVIQNVKFGMIKDCQLVSSVSNGTLVVPAIRNVLSETNLFISVSFANNTTNNTGIFQIESTTTTYNNRTVYAVIEYTKVTD